MQRRAEEVKFGTNKAVRSLALAINQTVILSTPVKTGHARANWQVSLAAPIDKELDAEDKSGTSTIVKNKAVILTRPPRVDIILSNNVPYINELNRGSSAQAPASFVQIAILAAAAALQKAKIFK